MSGTNVRFPASKSDVFSLIQTLVPRGSPGVLNVGVAISEGLFFLPSET